MNSDLISREDLKKKIEEVQYTQEFCIEHQIDYSISMQMLGMVIDNASEVELANHLRDRIKDIDHEITIPQSYEAKCFLNGKRKAFQYVLDLLEIKRSEEG